MIKEYWVSHLNKNHYKKKYISIQKKKTVPASTGGSMVVYETIATIGAKIETKKNSANYSAGLTLDSKVTHIFEIIYRSDIDSLEKIYIDYRSKKYEVLNIVNIDEDNKLLELNSALQSKE